MRRKIIIVILCALSYQVCATDYVVISEVLYDTPLNEDVSYNPHNYGEFVELYNAGDYEVNLSGWSLRTTNPNQTFYFADYILAPKSFVVVAYGARYEYNVTIADGDYFSDFHYLYDLPDSCSVIFQNSLILPNTSFSLLLKDNNSITKDSLVLGFSSGWYETVAVNSDESDIYQVLSDNLYSVKRTMTVFDISGSTPFVTTHWEGMHLDASPVRNSVGYSPVPLYLSVFMSDNPSEINNYCMTITPLSPLSNINNPGPDANITGAMVSVEYYDGLGRKYETVMKGLSPTHNNITTFTEYDSYNRISKEWLPLPTCEYRLTKEAFQNISSLFYPNETRAFNETLYSYLLFDDNTTLRNEITGERKAGQDMNGHHTGIITFGNPAASIKLFKVENNGSLTNAGYYAAKALLCERTTDEDNRVTDTYRNKQGQTVMQRRGGNSDTYYVYNDLGQLTYVLTPEASARLGLGTYSRADDILRKYAYLYDYDKRGNCIMKRLPGCEQTDMIYDKAGRMVFSSSGEQLWWGNPTLYMYDKFGRSVYSLENEVQETYYFMSDFNQAVTDVVTKEECFTGYAQNHELEDTYYSDTYITETEGHVMHSVNYYDDYTFLQYANASDSLQYDNSKENIYGVRSNKTKGLLTGSRTYLLNDDNDYIETAYYYDYRGRLIQERSTNHFGGCDIKYNAYDFIGNITQSLSTKSATGVQYVKELYTYTYDHAGRLTQTTYQLNDNPAMVMNQLRYDELGRLACKRIYDSVDSVKYSYNIRNQLTKIKYAGFEQNLYYNTYSPCDDYELAGIYYNGNISSSTWTYNNQTNGYMYYYDNQNRLYSTYSIMNGEWTDMLYTEYFEYDKNGNITDLYRFDEEDMTDFLDFTYNGNRITSISDYAGYYTPSVNTKHYQDLANAQTEFEYDRNGNMTKDLDRDICRIRYNVLNLPDRIQFRNGSQIAHTYDGMGNRIRTRYYERKSTAPITTNAVLCPEDSLQKYDVTHYMFNDNVRYKEYVPTSDIYVDYVMNPEGYYRYYISNDRYPFYYVRDHLGNICQTWIYAAANYKTCVQKMQYYPSGLTWNQQNGATEHPFRYNGKELVEQFNLDEYDSKARWYYPSIMRTTTMDPLCEKYYDTSPYAWCGNNSVNSIDFDGKKLL